MVPQIGETRALKCALNLDFGSLTRGDLLEERAHPGIAREGQRAEKAVGAKAEETLI